MTRWIRTSDCLPHPGEAVWLWEDGSVWIGGRTVEDGKSRWGHCYGEYWLRTDGRWVGEIGADADFAPTHWMPLPEPPKEEPKRVETRPTE